MRPDSRAHAAAPVGGLLHHAAAVHGRAKPSSVRPSAGSSRRASTSRACIVLRGSRGAAAAALGLDYHVDDRPQNCVDVAADSTAKTILIVSESNHAAIASARKLGIGVAHRIGDALDVLDQATLAATNRSLFRRIAKMVGWK